jgi:hypothetical protein
MFSRRLGDLLLMFPGGHGNSRNGPDCRQPTGHRPIGSEMAKVLHQHDRDRGERKARRNHEGDGN